MPGTPRRPLLQTAACNNDTGARTRCRRDQRPGPGRHGRLSSDRRDRHALRRGRRTRRPGPHHASCRTCRGDRGPVRPGARGLPIHACLGVCHPAPMAHLRSRAAQRHAGDRVGVLVVGPRQPYPAARSLRPPAHPWSPSCRGIPTPLVFSDGAAPRWRFDQSALVRTSRATAHAPPVATPPASPALTPSGRPADRAIAEVARGVDRRRPPPAHPA